MLARPSREHQGCFRYRFISCFTAADVTNVRFVVCCEGCAKPVLFRLPYYERDSFFLCVCHVYNSEKNAQQEPGSTVGRKASAAAPAGRRAGKMEYTGYWLLVNGTKIL